MFFLLINFTYQYFHSKNPKERGRREDVAIDTLALIHAIGRGVGVLVTGEGFAPAAGFGDVNT